MTSAAFAVTLSSLWNRGSLKGTLGFGLVTLIFAYTTVANIIERPDGIKIASLFIAAIVATSLVSRVRRSLERTPLGGRSGPCNTTTRISRR